MSVTETAGWILARIYENDATKRDDLTRSEVVFYLEGWGEDCDENIINQIIELHHRQ